jgi:hypothetical protein
LVLSSLRRPLPGTGTSSDEDDGEENEGDVNKDAADDEVDEEKDGKEDVLLFRSGGTMKKFSLAVSFTVTPSVRQKSYFCCCGVCGGLYNADMIIHINTV